MVQRERGGPLSLLISSGRRAPSSRRVRTVRHAWPTELSSPADAPAGARCHAPRSVPGWQPPQAGGACPHLSPSWRWPITQGRTRALRHPGQATRMISVQPLAGGPQCAAAAAWPGALSRNAASGARTQATGTGSDARLWLRTAHVLSKCANLNAFVVQYSLYRTTISGSISSGTDNCPMCQKVLAGKASMTATIIKMVVLRSKAGFSPDLESTRMWEASLENAKQPPFGICGIRSIWLQLSSFPRARPRMCRREDQVAALNLIEAHSHTLSSFRRKL